MTTNGTQYLVADHLGSTRMVLGADGMCVHRIDYLPFGGESPRTEPCYGGDPPTNPSSVSLKFTGKERDAETGLDYFGARYLSGMQGRFISADPLLSSGNPWDLQTWNRYSYAQNNPLKFVDPNGLYNLVNKCETNDSNCHHQFEQDAALLKAGLARLQEKVSKLKDGLEKKRLQTALEAFGTEGDLNNVMFSFGKSKGSGAANVEPNYDEFSNTYKSFDVRFVSLLSKNPDDYGIAAAHETTHIDDYNKYMLNPATIMAPFQVEYRGYHTSAWAASALGYSSFSPIYNGKKITILKSNWGAVDDKVLTNFIKTFQDKEGNFTHPEVQPHNPFPN